MIMFAESKQFSIFAVPFEGGWPGRKSTGNKGSYFLKLVIDKQTLIGWRGGRVA